MLIDIVRDFIKEHGLLPEGAHLVAGLSGGIDSVVLVHLLRELGYAVTAAHVNYGLREAAEGDEAFVRRYCTSFDPPMPLRVAKRDAEARAERRGASLQASARRQRYAFFVEVAQAEDAARVAVGHHRRDQAETLLLNLMRGSGPEGLAGMRPKRRLGAGEGTTERREAAWLVRPLLAASREQIAAYAEAHGLHWRRDHANRDPRFKRAALRRDVLPALETHFPGATDRLARTAVLMSHYVDEALRPELRRRFEAMSQPEEEGGTLDLDALSKAPLVWQGRLLLEALRRWCPGAPRTQAAARELRALLDAQPGRHVAFGAHRVWRERSTLRFVRKAEGNDEAEEQPLAPDQPARLPGGTVRVELLPKPPASLDPGGPNTAFLDAGRLCFPLAVRPWEDGDRFQPLGMAGTKPVSDLLTDAKVPPSERRRVPVVCSGGTVVWVVGHRLAEPVKVRASTQQVARLTFEPAGE